MSVYSYVELKVHTNVRKVGTHLNVWYIERMFAESTPLCLYERSIYLYIMNISLSRPFLFLSLLYYIYIREHSFPHLPFAPHLSYPYILFIIYSIYREEHTFPQLLLLYPLSHTFIILLLYIEEETFYPPPFYPFL